jgi:UPF0716 protein FxsA
MFMRVLFLMAILLAFPVMEIWLLVELGDRYGWWLGGYLLLVAILGWRLILDEKLLMLGRMAQTLSQGGTPAKAIFGSAKNLVAGVLLILPGVISDALAVLLLLVPAPKPVFVSRGTPEGRTSGAQAANDDVIEGEFRRED